MRHFSVISKSICLLIAIHFSVSGQETNSKAPPKTVAPPVPKPAIPSVPAKAALEPVKAAVPEQPAAVAQNAADEAAIRQAGEAYLKAFNEANAKGVAELYTSDAEYIDEDGDLVQGRTAIENSLKSFFAENPESRLELKIVSIRFVGPGIAIEDGISTLVPEKDADPVTSRYMAVHMKHAGKWLLASVRDSALAPKRAHRVQLRQLEWMLGDWVHEGDDAVIFFSCELVDDGNFLIRNFSIQIAGEEAISGSQRIGWDAQAGKFKAWIFDSDGGFSEGYWHRDGDTWVLKTTGVTADGASASCTSIYSILNAHTMTFQSVDHEVAGVELPDSAKVKIVRNAPQPE